MGTYRPLTPEVLARIWHDCRVPSFSGVQFDSLAPLMQQSMIRAATRTLNEIRKQGLQLPSQPVEVPGLELLAAILANHGQANPRVLADAILRDLELIRDDLGKEKCSDDDG